jgi:hypothetical protein
MIISWGFNGSGQCNVPSLPPGVSYVEVAAGSGHTLARRSDGSVVAWGDNGQGQCDVPVPPIGLSYVDIAAGANHSVAIRSDGIAVAWGQNDLGQCNIPALPPGQYYTRVAAAKLHTLVLRSNGSIAACGFNANGQCNVPALPSGTTYVDIAAGGNHSLALRSNGTGIGWGLNVDGQCNVPALPPGRRYTQLACGGGGTTGEHSLGLRDDGTAIGWGSNYVGQCNVPQLQPATQYAAISAGHSHSVALLLNDYCPNDPNKVAPGQCGCGTPDTDTDGDGVADCIDGCPLDSNKFSPGACGCGVPDVLIVFYLDFDGDGYGVDSVFQPGFTCSPPIDYVPVSGDCDDADPLRHPGAPEICDGLDNDCDGTVDEGFISNYCTAGTTVSGCVPSIRGEGAPSSVAGSGFDVVVDNVPAQRMGLIFYGQNAIPQPQPWGVGSASYICIYYPVSRTGAHSSGGAAGTCGGQLRVDFNAFMVANPLAVGSPFHAGQVLHAQGWFRDPGAAKQTNLSNGLRFTLCN